MNKLTSEQVKAAEALLSNGDRVELIPAKDGGVILTRIRRETVKTQRQNARHLGI